MNAEAYPVQLLPSQTRQNCARLLLMAFEVSELNNAKPWHSKRFEQRVITPHLFPESYYHLRQMRARSIQLLPVTPIERFRPILQIGLGELVEAGEAWPDDVSHCQTVLGWSEPEPLARVIPFDTGRTTDPAATPDQYDTIVIPLRLHGAC